jgi:hypothetical protein
VTIFNRSLIITILGVPFLAPAGAGIACGWLWGGTYRAGKRVTSRATYRTRAMRPVSSSQ